MIGRAAFVRSVRKKRLDAGHLQFKETVRVEASREPCSRARRRVFSSAVQNQGHRIDRASLAHLLPSPQESSFAERRGQSGKKNSRAASMHQTRLSKSPRRCRACAREKCWARRSVIGRANGSVGKSRALFERARVACRISENTRRALDETIWNCSANAHIQREGARSMLIAESEDARQVARGRQ